MPAFSRVPHNDKRAPPESFWPQIPAFATAPPAYADEREMRMSGSQAGRRSGARRNTRIGAIGALAVVAASVIVHGAVAGPAPTLSARVGSRLVVATTDGSIRGKPAGAMDEFLGLPYAAPPTGPLRWPTDHARRWSVPPPVHGAMV